MLGVHHAGTGAAAWVAVTAAHPLIPSLSVMPLPAAAVALGGIVTAGAALAPDADHPSATISYSIPGIGKAVTSAIGAASGGHRHGTHSGLSAIVVLLAAWWITGYSGLVNADYLSAYVVLCGLIAAAFLTFAVKVLKVVRSWGVAWVTGIGLSALVTFVYPDMWAWLPWSVAVGWVTHLAGDFLTTGGLPLTWPWKARAPKAFKGVPVLGNVWTQGGYFALPILGNTGSVRETLLAVPLTLYGAYGIFVSALALTPALDFLSVS